MIYYLDKLKKRIHVQEANVITMKENIDLLSLAQWMHFLLDMFLMAAIVIITHLNSSTEFVSHFDALFFSVWHESFDSWPLQQWIMNSSHTRCPSRTPKDKKEMTVSDQVNVETTRVRISCWSAD